METPERVEVRGGDEVILTWEDGSTTALAARVLRAGCRCASCREPAGIQATAAVLGGDAPVRIAGARLVGAYALSFVFEPDGHATGIFPFELLQSLADRSGVASPGPTATEPG